MNYNELIGIRFKENGDDLYGINCYNLLRKTFAKHNLFVPETNISVCACQQASNQEIQDNIMQYWEPIDRPIEPCGVLIQSTNPNFANHIGTYIGNNRMLHITMSTNSIIERMIPKYKNKVLGFYKFIGGDI